MSKKLTILGILLAVMLFWGSSMAATVSMKLSGPGAINDSTIKAGDTVSLDIYWSNDEDRMGVSFGFSFKSKEIKNIIHLADSGNGLNKAGDIKGHNGWQGRAIWDATGVLTPEVDWDGKLPELIGFAGAVVKKRYEAHDEMKALSFDLIIPETGTLVVDSAFFPPGGYWKFGSGDVPEWKGPYSFKVVK